MKSLVLAALIVAGFSLFQVSDAVELAPDLATSPAPRPPIPSLRQMQWQELGFCGFLHFNMNTFTGQEWGNGDESEQLFNPTDFDADQIVRVAAESGMRGLILTCKHHDGFCLWPSRYTERSVKNSPWKNGRGDVVREISEACGRRGLKFGIYLSPWDRNRADYGRPEYIAYFRNQLRELLTSYGPIFEVWFDGANGGDGYYGGAREKRTIDRATYYDWSNTWALVRQLQPGACIFSDAGPDIRWVGNEDGHAGSTCWDTLNRRDFAPGLADEARLNHGDRLGADWVPAECDVSIRPGWFYRASEDDKVKSAAQLLDLYFASVGRGAGLLLNVPPDRRGQIANADAQSLREFHQALAKIFVSNLAQGATAEASNVRGNSDRFAAHRVFDNRDDTYWATDDGVTNAQLVLTLAKPTTFNIVSLREYLPLGQRVGAFAVDQWKEGAWVEFASGTSIGQCRLVRGAPVTTEKVRLRVMLCAPGPAIAEVGLYAERP
jgi:alpha-L-fucosidase